MTEPPFLIPSIDRLLGTPAGTDLCAMYGRLPVVEALRSCTAALRAGAWVPPEADVTGALLAQAGAMLAEEATPSLRPVFNLTGTVLHTNLGRAPLPRAALEGILRVAGTANTLEFDLQSGRRGDRDAHVEALLCKLTGAEAATVVNNNAAAVLLVLTSLARRREVLVSRGELVEIGGSFRIPEVMTSAGARLREVGATNRVHLRDYAEALAPTSALIMKVHPSNYRIEGFTASVPETELAALAREAKVPFVVDLGSGTFIDFEVFGLPHEPTVQETLAHGADLVTFSGDKLLGGPQAGIIAGRADLVRRIKKHPMMRALRVDKLILSALESTLRLYGDTVRAQREIPALRLLARPRKEIEACAARVLPVLRAAVATSATVEAVDCASQIGSGALPVDLLPSIALAVQPRRAKGRTLDALAAAFRALPIPVIGRLHQGALLFDLRCLEDETGFLTQLDQLKLPT